MPDTLALLRRTTTATVNHVLTQRGAQETCLEGVRSLTPLRRRTVAGRAVTVRYLPGRPDSADVRQRFGQGGPSPLLVAIEQLGPGRILVVDALSRENCGVAGDILVGRMAYLRAEAVVVDGAVRDSPILYEMSVPVFARAVHPAATKQLFPYEQNVPIQCGGGLVCPEDYVLCDADGVVVVPAQWAAEVAAEAVEKEELEAVAREFLLAGARVEEVYPAGPAVRAEYEKRRAARAGSDAS